MSLSPSTYGSLHWGPDWGPTGEEGPGPALGCYQQRGVVRTLHVLWSLPPVGSTEKPKPRSVIRVAARQTPRLNSPEPWRKPWRLSLGQLEKAGHFNPPGSRTCLLASCGLKNPTHLSPAPLDLANMQWTLT